VPLTEAGRRFDQVLAGLFPEHSRSRLQRLIRDGQALADGRRLRARDRLAGGERVVVRIPAERQGGWVAQSIPLAVLHQDEDLLVLDKPPGLVVHPGAGNPDRTLLNALLHHDPGLAALPRAGIVHRLDKDTSGLLVVARSARAHTRLVAALAARAVRREYLALVLGHPAPGAGTVSAAIGRDPRRRTRMAVRAGSGRSATTHYRVLERLAGASRVRLRLETGRTHQIRVHMAHLGHPVLGDPAYGGRARDGAYRRSGMTRQALHACRLSFRHPGSGEPLTFTSPLPADIRAALAALRSGP